MTLPKELKTYAMLVGKLTAIQDNAKVRMKEYIK